MKYSVSHFIGAIFAVPVALIVGFISINFFVVDQWLDWLLMIGSYFGAYIPIQLTTSNQYLNEVGLSRREYKYVRKHLNEAKPKIKVLLSQYTKIRSYSDFKNINEINRIARAIYKTVQKNPKKFFKVDSFFFSHLDNTVNLINQYVYLVRMPHKNHEEINQLNAAKITLEELKRTLHADLRALNAEDYQQMSVEVDLAKINQLPALDHTEQVEVPVLKSQQKERIER
ncbi:5-bromo-4-chloroindolyl phosphate hydrolysis family protein [Macrococcus equipercicus]|uniref:5-bromo-4-chloroindolyl phosphate hydrolase n=1 Tax=Macrococcus equipercicus TaxID=69967 RepID=A0A9Q9BLN0_9STAP|nr:5-bromo-4-chloroindolyl phosphate hydrolysis family protein [Macrococcus equipercicus]KAA1040245.1 5-bromo-4-chloroindolyl phosphate hydrolase [Macrococcus equipercicus]UTH12810.1 5-bromo-4-chloroindolyl phosphate hydrolysis family protein [Macrococcus equipercicus]